MKTLYLVATPIGNLEDFSPRGVATLQLVDKIYAEDTRRTINLLQHFEIRKPLESYFEGNELRRIPEILGELSTKDIALVSDAGTPTISDPGFKLVREVISSGHQVVPIPGPNAAVLAVTVSGLPTDRFTFLGFLPKKKSARRTILEEVKDLRTTLIIYESPYRVGATLADLWEILGERSVSISRELTKLHEETLRGTLSEMKNKITTVKGEVTIVVGSKDYGSPQP